MILERYGGGFLFLFIFFFKYILHAKARQTAPLQSPNQGNPRPHIKDLLWLMEAFVRVEGIAIRCLSPA